MSNIQEFWEQQHQARSQQWLTGTQLKQIMKFYSLTEQDLENKKFLEIGVGLATVSKALSTMVSTLYCADISQEALKRVQSYVTGTWSTTEIELIPCVDIALCHLVLVHCNDTECVRILKSINLNENGKIFCQFSCLKSFDAIEHADSKVKKMLLEDGPHFFRTEDEIQNIINQAGLKTIEVSDHNPGSYHGWVGQYWKCYQLEKSI